MKDEEDGSDEKSDHEIDEEMEELSAKPLPEITTADLVAQRHMMTRKYKLRIAQIAHQIIENPDEYV